MSPTEQNRKRAIGINHFNKLALLFTYTMYISDIFDNYYDSNNYMRMSSVVNIII